MRFRDFYFASWVILKGYEYRIEDGKLYISNLSKEELDTLYTEYKTLKPLFSKVKKLIRVINNQRKAAISCRTK